MKGICFIPPLHDKTVKKTKTETRRIITKQPLENESIKPFVKGFFGIYHKVGGIDNLKLTLKPRYNVGEILYLKEPYCIGVNGCDTLPSLIYYKYNEKDMSFLTRTGLINDIKWKNKLFMPAYAARHFIKVTAVRAERLHDISDEDCIKEGIEICKYDTRHFVNDIWGKSKLDGTWENTRTLYDTPKQAYKALINSIDGKDTWDNNPWVWVYDYKLIDRKEVQI